MPRGSPTLEGFRASFRQPSLTLVELAWRWTVGAIAGALFFFGLFEYLNTLLVTKSDAALLSTKQPLLIARALADVLAGSLHRAVLSALVAALALALLWIVAASFGRIATVRGLLLRFRERATAAEGLAGLSTPLAPVVGLNFLRVVLALAALLSMVGAALLAGFVFSNKNPQPGLAFLLWMTITSLVLFLWFGLNWLLSLGAIFAIRDGNDSVAAVSSAIRFSRTQAGPLAALGTWTGLAHLVAFSLASTAVSIPLAFIQVVSWKVIAGVIVVMMVIYFAIVDWLYIVRLAGYIFIAETPEALAEPAPLPPIRSVPPQSSMDRDELILSDLPNLAIEPYRQPP